MSQTFKNNQIRIKVIKLKRSFDIEVRQNHSLNFNSKKRLQIPTIRPYKFPEYEETETPNNQNVFVQLLNKEIHIPKESPSDSKYEAVSKQKGYKKLNNFSYNTQKTQKSVRGRMAIENIKHIRSISISNFGQQAENKTGQKSRIKQILRKYDNKVNKVEQSIQRHQNATSQENEKLSIEKMLEPLPRKSNFRVKTQSFTQPQNKSFSFFLSTFHKNSKKSSFIKHTEKKFMIDPWEVREEKVT